MSRAIEGGNRSGVSYSPTYKEEGKEWKTWEICLKGAIIKIRYTCLKIVDILFGITEVG